MSDFLLRLRLGNYEEFATLISLIASFGVFYKVCSCADLYFYKQKPQIASDSPLIKEIFKDILEIYQPRCYADNVFLGADILDIHSWSKCDISRKRIENKQWVLETVKLRGLNPALIKELFVC